MRVNKNDLSVAVNAAPTATVKQHVNFGDVSAMTSIAGEHVTLDKGADFAPLLAGLDNDLCHCPHFGYILKGDLTVQYLDGTIEHVKQGDLFFWKGDHTLKANEESEFVMFSPVKEHKEVLDHVVSKLAA